MRSSSSESAKKKFILDLLPKKIPVQTSLGTLYVRCIDALNWKQLDSEVSEELGKATVGQLASRIEEKGDDTPLSAEDLNALVEVDFNALAPAIAKQCNWGKLAEGLAVQALGELAKAERERERDTHKKQLNDMRKSVKAAYGFLGKGGLDRLKEQLTGMADVRASLRNGFIPDGLKNSMLGAGAYEEAMRHSGLSDTLKGIASANAYDETVRAAARNDRLISPTALPIPQVADLLDFPMPPRPENTPLGRAAVETAQQTEKIAQLMAVLTDMTAGLNQAVVAEILPDLAPGLRIP